MANLFFEMLIPFRILKLYLSVSQCIPVFPNVSNTAVGKSTVSGSEELQIPNRIKKSFDSKLIISRVLIILIFLLFPPSHF